MEIRSASSEVVLIDIYGNVDLSLNLYVEMRAAPSGHFLKYLYSDIRVSLSPYMEISAIRCLYCHI